MTEKELCRAIGTLCNVYELTDMTYKQYLRHIKEIETEYPQKIIWNNVEIFSHQFYDNYGIHLGQVNVAVSADNYGRNSLRIQALQMQFDFIKCF